ncbi:MAG: heme-dependent oxidative N-demethylase subunit alpha family protein [Myxococcota bacterium]
MMGAPPRYFPVAEAPLRMAPSLARFGSDFGQGTQDQRYFQVDDRYEEFRRLKARAPSSVRFVSGVDTQAQAARRDALSWMRSTWAREHPPISLPAESGELAEDFARLAGVVQEDFALLGAGDDDRGRTLLVDVCFPSGWRPERLREADFTTIHGPVPGFPDRDKAARAMVKAMVERGPYVRFVWTVSPVPDLDQHPDRLDRGAAWTSSSELWLRVERQVTVPLARARAGLFLIRVHMTPISSLRAQELERLRQAIAVMPEDVRSYKGLPSATAFERALERLPRIHEGR